MKTASRIEYVDSIRGFAIILVVIGHILLFSYGDKPDNNWLFRLIYIFHMPLFFFISGYLTYKEKSSVTFQKLKSEFTKKTLSIFLPTITIIGISAFIYNYSFSRILFDPMKIGYWFTFVLFQTFILYFLIKFILDKYFSHNIVETIVFIFIILLSFILSNFRFYLDIPWVKALSFNQTICYIQFFLVGILAKKHQTIFLKLCNNHFFIFIVFSLAVFLFHQHENVESGLYKVIPQITSYYEDVESGLYKVIPRIASYCCLLFVFIVFYRYQETFSSQTKLGKSLTYIGQHTLEIYFLHYFFLFKLPIFNNYLLEHPQNFLLIFIVTVVLAILLVVWCLFLTKIINIIKPLSYLLFGPRKNY